MTSTPTITVSATVSAATGRQAAAPLQEQLSELLDLTLKGKHAHWNVVGTHFMPVHLLLDDITAHLRDWSDLVAERIVQLGVPVRGQADAITKSGLPPLANDGPIPAAEAVEQFAELLTTSAKRGRERAVKLGDVDLVTQNLLLDVLQGMEKDIWFLRAQLQ